jgi:putative transport protein
MLELFLNYLIHNKLLLLFIVIAIGYFLGKIKIKGFSLGIANVLFVGLAFGSLSENLALPDIIYTMGLVLFIYTSGLQSGPTFFRSFNKIGITYNLTVMAVLIFSSIITILIGKYFSIESSLLSGVFCGSLTNTPALASIVDTIKQSNQSLSQVELNQLVGKPIAGYSITYPAGVIGVIFSMYIFRIIFKINLEKESIQIANKLGLGGEDLNNKDIRITNVNILGKSIADIFSNSNYSDVIVSRIKKKDSIQIVNGKTILELNDIITLVGSLSNLNKLITFFGEDVISDLSTDRAFLDFRRIFVSNKKIIGLSIRELDLHQKFNATITRVKRGDSEIIPTMDTILESGDRIRVVASRDDMDKVSKFFGDSFHSLSEIDYISISLGITIGLLLGEIPIPLPGGATFKLGSAGGPLLVSLVLGYFERTGNLVWGMSYNANLTVRQLGVVLFLAGIGLKAGYSFGENLSKYGIILLITGLSITLLNTILMILIGRFILKIPYPLLMGIISGMQTQPACIAYVNGEIKNSVPNFGYSLVFPVSMITKIILVQIIFTIMNI